MFSHQDLQMFGLNVVGRGSETQLPVGENLNYNDLACLELMNITQSMLLCGVHKCKILQ